MIRLGFIKEVEYNIFSHIDKDYKEEEKDKLDTTNEKKKFSPNKALFFLVIFAIMTKTINNEQENNLNIESWKIDMEKPFFDIHNKLTHIKKVSPDIYNKLFYYSGKLICLFTIGSTKFDKYISDVGTYLDKLKVVIESLIQKNDEELNIFKKLSLELIGFLFEQSETKLFGSIAIDFIINLIFSIMIHNSDYIIKGNEHNTLMRRLTKGYQRKYPGSFIIIGDEGMELNLPIKQSLTCFYKFLKSITTDITTGKNLWKSVEVLINSSKEEQSKANNIIFLITFSHIFKQTSMEIVRSKPNNHNNKEKKLESENSDENQTKNKIILSSIFEFLFEKLISTKIRIVINFNN